MKMRIRKEILILPLFVVICCSNIAFYKNKEIEISDEIVWSPNRKLIWEDFKGTPPEAPVESTVAVTCSTMDLEFHNAKNYKVESKFIKSKSWTVTDDPGMLSHEQLHFDITELHVRKIRKSFDSLSVRKITNFANYDEIYKSNIEKCNKYQDLYDSEVLGNNKNQQQWIKKVTAELLKLKRFEQSSEN